MAGYEHALHASAGHTRCSNANLESTCTSSANMENNPRCMHSGCSLTCVPQNKSVQSPQNTLEVISRNMETTQSIAFAASQQTLASQPWRQRSSSCGRRQFVLMVRKSAVVHAPNTSWCTPLVLMAMRTCLHVCSGEGEVWGACAPGSRYTLSITLECSNEAAWDNAWSWLLPAEVLPLSGQNCLWTQFYFRYSVVPTILGAGFLFFFNSKICDVSIIINIITTVNTT